MADNNDKTAPATQQAPAEAAPHLFALDAETLALALRDSAQRPPVLRIEGMDEAPKEGPVYILADGRKVGPDGKEVK